MESYLIFRGYHAYHSVCYNFNCSRYLHLSARYAEGNLKKLFSIILKNLCGIFIVFYLVHYMISYCIYLFWNYTICHLSNRDPLWKFTVSLIIETKGGYSHEDAVYIMSIEIGEERNLSKKS